MFERNNSITITYEITNPLIVKAGTCPMYSTTASFLNLNISCPLCHEELFTYLKMYICLYACFLRIYK